MPAKTKPTIEVPPSVNTALMALVQEVRGCNRSVRKVVSEQYELLALEGNRYDEKHGEEMYDNFRRALGQGFPPLPVFKKTKYWRQFCKGADRVYTYMYEVCGKKVPYSEKVVLLRLTGWIINYMKVHKVPIGPVSCGRTMLDIWGVVFDRLPGWSEAGFLPSILRNCAMEYEEDEYYTNNP